MGLLDKLKKDEDKKSEKTVDGGGDSAKKETKKKADGEEKKKKASVAKTARSARGNAYRVLIKPLVTEKASVMGTLNKYFFEVAKEANKIEVAKAVYDVYGVKPEKVNIVRMRGKVVRRGRITGKRKDWKKAVVTLKKGDSIKVYEGV